MKFVVSACLAVLWWAGPAHADGRQYLETWPYQTEPEGQTQLLTWNDWFDGSPRHQVELEHAFTDRFQAEIYANWQDNGDGNGTHYQSTLLEARYRLQKYKKWFLDPAIYAVYEKTAVVGQPDNFEVILILSKDIGNLNVTTNYSWAKPLVGGEPIDFHYTVGVSYPLNKPTTYGLEALVFPADHQSFLLPGIYTALGRNTWVNVGLQIALQPATNPVNLRSIFWVKL